MIVGRSNRVGGAESKRREQEEQLKSGIDPEVLVPKEQSNYGAIRNAREDQSKSGAVAIEEWSSNPKCEKGSIEEWSCGERGSIEERSNRSLDLRRERIIRRVVLNQQMINRREE